MDSPERPIWTSLSASSGSCSTGSLLRWPWQPRTRHPPPSSCPPGWWWSSCRWMGGWVVLWVQLLLSGWRSIGRKQRASEGGRGLLSQLANPKSNLSWISCQLQPGWAVPSCLRFASNALRRSAYLQKLTHPIKSVNRKMNYQQILGSVSWPRYCDLIFQEVRSRTNEDFTQLQRI